MIVNSKHILDRRSGVTLVLTQYFKNITRILFRVCAPLSPRLQGQEGMQNLTRLDHDILE